MGQGTRRAGDADRGVVQALDDAGAVARGSLAARAPGPGGVRPDGEAERGHAGEQIDDVGDRGVAAGDVHAVEHGDDQHPDRDAERDAHEDERDQERPRAGGGQQRVDRRQAGARPHRARQRQHDRLDVHRPGARGRACRGRIRPAS